MGFHIATVHEGLKPFICSTCNYNAKKMSALNKHIEQVHEEIKKKECEYCYKRFGTKGSLKRHIDKFHQGNLKQHIVKVHKPNSSSFLKLFSKSTKDKGWNSKSSRLSDCPHFKPC